MLLFFFFFGFLVLVAVVPKGKHTTIDLDNREELGALPDRSKRSNLNPQIHIEEVGPPRIRENPRRLSSKISSLTREDRSHKEVGEEESSSGPECWC